MKKRLTFYAYLIPIMISLIFFYFLVKNINNLENQNNLEAKELSFLKKQTNDLIEKSSLKTQTP